MTEFIFAGGESVVSFNTAITTAIKIKTGNHMERKNFIHKLTLNNKRIKTRINALTGR
jgi:hypothetical protein